MSQPEPTNDIWAMPCVCEHLFADHWFDLTIQPPQPDTGCRECAACEGFTIMLYGGEQQ